ncbi:MAG: cobyrinate a,c-diamide synthase [Deltaproteobacteria bacterium]|nr:cobyrinate a,c-diamide synthase [Deltaproteobacteria bacterium]
MTNEYPRLIVAALRGGAGKTVLSMGLIAAWRNKGLKVVPFKKGPDYIDAGWLSLAAGRPCYNLDSFLMEQDQLLRSFTLHAGKGRVALVEGNRGLFDGMDLSGRYSTAELAKSLIAPVVLVVDCSLVTRTSAAMVLGCQQFDPDVEIKGVVLNRVARSRHESIVRSSIEKYCGVPVIGAVPRQEVNVFPERHLGLLPYEEHPATAEALAEALKMVEANIDLDKLLDVARQAVPMKQPLRLTRKKAHSRGRRARIGVMRDSAFQFYYHENLEELTRLGATLVEISALREKKLPEIDLLYIGGGFPETHAEALAENNEFRMSLKKAIECGLPVYAECGGFMYLGESLIFQGKTYPMVGALPVVFGFEHRPQGHGYTILEVRRPNPFFPEGSILRGHEFHYSRVLRWKENQCHMAFSVKRGHGLDGSWDGLCHRNVLAMYTHLHALGTKGWAQALIQKAVSSMRLQRAMG